VPGYVLHVMRVVDRKPLGVLVALALAGCVRSGGSTTSAGAGEEATMAIQSMTPILIVEAIEPVLPFWEALGFERVAEVPHGDGLGFVILGQGSSLVMYQTTGSMDLDIPAVSRLGPFRSVLYLRVVDVEGIAARVPEAEVVVPLRTTPYGAREIFVREPGGHIVAFAQLAQEAE